MQKMSFVTGLIAGGAVSLGLVVAFPGLLSTRAQAPQRSPRQSRPSVAAAPVRAELPPAPAQSAGAQKEHGLAAVDLEQEAQIIAKAMLARRLRANEIAAIATLRNIISAQAQFQATAVADENQNGIGEYGGFGELSGAVGVREGRVMNPPVLSTAFRELLGGRAKRNGYYYRIFLPRPDGRGTGERDEGGFRARELDPNVAETVWCAYAWPVKQGVTGNRTFFVNQAGDILACTDGNYSDEDEPSADAAFEAGAIGITGPAAAGKLGGDGVRWKQAG